MRAVGHAAEHVPPGERLEQLSGSATAEYTCRGGPGNGPKRGGPRRASRLVNFLIRPALMGLASLYFINFVSGRKKCCINAGRFF